MYQVGVRIQVHARYNPSVPPAPLPDANPILVSGVAGLHVHYCGVHAMHAGQYGDKDAGVNEGYVTETA